MKRIQYHRYGGPDVMRLETFTPDLPGAGEVSVAVRFAAINPIDWKVRNGMMKIVTGRSFPRAMGLDLSGIVSAVGQGVTRFTPGDAVFGMARFKEAGALGQMAIARESDVALKPSEVSFEDAACLGTPGVTAWNALIDKAELQPGQSLFVNGCAGAVGEAAVQIARMTGALVSGSCASGSMDRVSAYHLQRVYDYRVCPPSTMLERFDVVFDAAGTMSTREGLNLLRPGGRFATTEPTPLRFLRAMVDRRVKPIVGTPRAKLLDALAKAARDEKIRLPIAEIVPLTSAIGLLAALEAGRRLRGKAVIAMG